MLLELEYEKLTANNIQIATLNNSQAIYEFTLQNNDRKLFI